MKNKHQKFMEEAYKEAQISLQQGGILIGAILVKNDEIIGRGHNKRIQQGSSILHAEMDCLENAGRLRGQIIRNVQFKPPFHRVPCVPGQLYSTKSHK